MPQVQLSMCAIGLIAGSFAVPVMTFLSLTSDIIRILVDFY
jgi:hypothetical protein